MNNTIKNIALIAIIGIVATIAMPLACAVSNNDIASAAISYDGQTICQCKCFVQRVLDRAGGSLGTGYAGCYGDTEIQPSQAMWGDIIQISNDDDPECALLSDGNIYDGMHTAIVLENNGNNEFKIIDSNYFGPNLVGTHPWNPISWASNHGLDAHFYRLGATDHWDFNIPPYTQGWTAPNVVSTSVAPDGRYRIDPKENDPWTQIDGLLLNADNYNAVEMNMASNCLDGNARIYFTTESSPSYSESKMVEFKTNNNGDWHTYTIYMANHNLWQGTITGIRIDPAENGRASGVDTVGFDWIKVINTDKKPTIVSWDLDYFLYEGSDTLTFEYWINNPFANNIENVRLGAQIRPADMSTNWIDDWSSDRVVTLNSGTYEGSRKYERYFSLLFASAGYYDANWVILNHNTGAWYNNKEKANAFIIESSPPPVIVDPTPTPTPTPTAIPAPTPTPTATPTPTPEPTPDNQPPV